MRPMEQISYNEIRAAGVADQAYSTSNCWPAEPGDDSLLKLLRNKTNIDELRDILYERVKAIHIKRYPYNDFLFQRYDNLED